MRKLIAKDIIPVGKILAKGNIKPILVDIFNQENINLNNLSNSEILMEYIFKLLENIDVIGDTLFELLAYIEETDIKNIEQLPLDELMELLKQLFGDKNFGSFFKFAAK